MRQVISLAAAVALAGTALMAQTGGGQQSTDEAAVRQLAAQYETAWNNKNAQQAAAVFADDALMISPAGQTLRGRAAIEQDLNSDFASMPAGHRVKVETDTVRFPSPDVAIVTGTTKFSGGDMPGSGEGHYMVVARKTGGEWKVTEVHAAAVPAEMVSPAATGTAGRSDVAAEEELRQLEERWMEAAKNKDTGFFEQLYHENYTFVSPSGGVMTRAEDIESLRSGEMVVESAQHVDVQPRIYGDTAIVTGVTEMKGTYKGEDISGRYRWTDAFVRQNGQWKAVASQVTRVQEPGK